MSEPNKTEESETVGVLDPPSEETVVVEPTSVDRDVSVDCCDLHGTCTRCPLVEGCSEAKLVEACRQGYNRAKRRLYELHRDRIMSLLMRMTGDHDEAFDLSQETFIRVFNRIGDFRGESALGTWIHRVAVNEALQYLRRKKRYQRITQAMAEDPKWSQPVLEDPGVSLDVRSALDQLPKRMREMVRLRYEKGLDYAEIARDLGIKQGTVASGLNRARRQLRHLLQ